MKTRSVAFLVILALGLFIVTAGCTQNPSGASSGTSSPATGSPDTSRQQNYTSNETLVAFVDSAAAYVKTHGKTRGARRIQQPERLVHPR